MEKRASAPEGTVILGGGLTGLTAGVLLSRAGGSVSVIEADAEVGGLSKTVHHQGYRFDLGGHRFFTTEPHLNQFLQNLMSDELIPVARSSKILMRSRLLDYPLKPANAFFGLGPKTSLAILLDYGSEKLKGLSGRKEPVSLEDWVVGNFGRTMFDIYFKVYSEKVWGIDCSRISAEWVDRRISGLSLARALKNAFLRAGGKSIPTLVDEFLYPRLGIGRISERLREEIEERNTVMLRSRIQAIHHDRGRINSVSLVSPNGIERKEGASFISSLPLTDLIGMLQPEAPAAIREAASRLRFRDLVVVAVMVDRPQVTDQTWIYIPEKKIPFGRIHEPTNWSSQMAPPGKSLLVIEYFSFRGDAFWNESDERLTADTVRHLEELGFLAAREVSGSMVVRVPKAYPLFEVGYQALCDRLHDYLAGFENFYSAGRSGMFRYYNMDHALDSGMKAAEAVLAAEEKAGRGRSGL